MVGQISYSTNYGVTEIVLYLKENEVHDTSACKQKLEEVGMEIWQDEMVQLGHLKIVCVPVIPHPMKTEI